MIKFSHEGSQTGDVPGNLPRPVGVANRPRLPGRSVLDPARKIVCFSSDARTPWNVSRISFLRWIAV
jgi:hypothetical protein